MEARIAKDLSSEQQTKFHEEMLAHCQRLIKMSRGRMTNYYSNWDALDDVYRGIRVTDEQDKKAKDEKAPEKMVVPTTYAQVQTFVAFCYSVLFQREYFYEVSPFAAEMEKGSRIAEGFLQRDLDYNNFHSLAYQFLLDVARFGLGIFKVGWVQETKSSIEMVQQEPGEFLGQPIAKPPEATKVTTVKFQGNKLFTISPYRFLPDPNFPICKFQSGEFCGSDDEYSYAALKQLEIDGAVAGVDFIPNMTRQEAEKFGSITGRFTNVAFSDDSRTTYVTDNKSNIVVTEIQVKIVPSKFMVGNTPLAQDDRPVKYLVWVANDKRVIRCEPLTYDHDSFTYAVAEFSPDQHHFVNEGLAGTIEQLQSVITWMINSHITSVRRVIANRLVVDPQGVEMDDVRNNRHVIRLKSGMSRLGPERWVHQLQVSDVTAKHMDDASQLEGLVQLVSGVSENALGQYHEGRRSATEARNVNAGAASRLKTQLSVIYYSAFEPLGRQMLSNLQQGLSVETYVRTFGRITDPMGEEYTAFVKASNKDFTGEYDFEILDGTLPSEKMWLAQTLQELLMVVLGNPQLALLLGFDIKKLMYEYLRLKGLRHPEKFAAGTQQQQGLIQLMQRAAGGNGAPTGNGGVGPAAAGGERQAPAGVAQR